jgi:hypothetical protein
VLVVEPVMVNFELWEKAVVLELHCVTNELPIAMSPFSMSQVIGMA